MDRGWPAFPRSELSGEEWTDSLASLHHFGITEATSGFRLIDTLRDASLPLAHSLEARSPAFGSKQLWSRLLTDSAITLQLRISPNKIGILQDQSECSWISRN